MNFILLRARRNEKEMKVKPATSFKIIQNFYLQQQQQQKTMCKTEKI